MDEDHFIAETYMIGGEGNLNLDKACSFPT